MVFWDMGIERVFKQEQKSGLSHGSLGHVLREYSQYSDRARPHQGLRQQIPESLNLQPGRGQCNDGISWEDSSTITLAKLHKGFYNTGLSFRT